MHAIIRAGGRQFRVAQGDTIKIERVNGNPGDIVKFHDVLLVSDGDDVKVGTPVVVDALVSGLIVEQGKHKKVISFRFRKRKDSKRIRGHRQQYTAVEINEIKA